MRLAAALILWALPACALIIFIGGLAWRVGRLLRAPVALPVELCPAPAGRLALARRLIGQVLTLGGLRRRRPGLWALSALFHLSLLALVLGHLELWAAPTPRVLIWLGLLRAPAGWGLAFSLLLLTARRLADPPAYRLTGRAGFALAGLLGAVALSGLALSLVIRPDPLALKSAALAMTGAAPLGWPGWGLGLHILLAAALLAAIPFTRLSHGFFMLLSPVTCRRAFDPARPRLGPLEPIYAAEEPSGEAAPPGETPLATAEGYGRRLEQRRLGRGAALGDPAAGPGEARP